VRPYKNLLLLAPISILIGASIWLVIGIQGTVIESPGPTPDRGTQTGQGRHYSETGHTVVNEFLEYYSAVPNPEFLYGYPLTEAFSDRQGRWVQYFQRAHFVLGQDGAVTLTPLGRLMYESSEVFPMTKSAGSCAGFGTGFDVCYDFLTFFEAYGGSAQFGVPISEVEQLGARFVQSFDFARFEWHPDSPDPALRIQLAHLGQLYFDRQGEDPARLPPSNSSAIVQVTRLQAHAFSAQAALRQDDAQSVFIIVRDQNLQSVSGAEVSLSVVYPNGRVLTGLSGRTNTIGFLEFVVPAEAAGGNGLAIVTAAVAHSGLTVETHTSYRIVAPVFSN